MNLIIYAVLALAVMSGIGWGYHTVKESGRMAWYFNDNYPWLSLITASYANEQRFGQTYQEDFSVVAGFTLPIWEWFGGDETAATRLEIQSLSEQEKLIKEQITIAVRTGLELLKEKRAQVSEFIVMHKDLKAEFEQIKAKVGTEGPIAAKQQHALDNQLLKLEMRALRVTRDYAQSLLEFESLIGTDLDEL